MKANTKEWFQYITAGGMIASGVVLTFLCFFLNHYQINDSVLWYMAQALVYAGSIFGVSMYIKTKWGEVKNDVKNMIDQELNKKEE